MEEQQDKKIQKLIYIAKQKNDQLENLMQEENIISLGRFFNQYNLTSLLQEDLKSLNNIDFLIIDLSAIMGSTEDKEIISDLEKLRNLHDFRIILICRGFRKGNLLLANIFNLGIYNIVTASTDSQMYDQLKICLSEKGMTFAQASQFRIDNMVATNKKTEILETKIEKIKQDISIGIIGVTNHIGTTTCAINILHFLNDLPSIKPCLIEANSHKDIKSIAELQEVDGLGVEHYKSIGEVRIGGMETYYDIKKIGDIKAQNYDFYIYDYGSISELDENALAGFLNKDIKFIVTGATPWEYKYLANCFDKLKLTENADGIFFIYNHTKIEKQKEIKEQMGNFNVYFNEYQPNPFEKKNIAFLEENLKRYLTNVSFEEVNRKNKKFKFNNIISKIKREKR